MAKKKKAAPKSAVLPYRYTVALVPVRGKKDEVCGVGCPLMAGDVVPFCRRDPTKSPVILDVVPKVGAMRTKECIESGLFVEAARARAFINKVTGG